jgi:hypothetical protein
LIKKGWLIFPPLSPFKFPKGNRPKIFPNKNSIIHGPREITWGANLMKEAVNWQALYFLKEVGLVNTVAVLAFNTPRNL